MIFHIIHRWSKWSYPVGGYGATVQFKVCLKCRKVKYREVGYAKQVKATSQVAAILSVESETGNSIEDQCDPVFISGEHIVR